MTSNQLQYWANQEAKRANIARERETIRNNLAREAETYRSNVVKETETERSNRASELLKEFSNLIEQGKLNESSRHNLATEFQAQNELVEQIRNNKNRNAADYIKVGGRAVGDLLKALPGIIALF